MQTAAADRAPIFTVLLRGRAARFQLCASAAKIAGVAAHLAHTTADLLTLHIYLAHIGIGKAQKTAVIY